MSSDVRSTLGAAFIGCMIAVGLSAVLGFQTFLYFRIFASDALRYKLLVGWIWATDVVHTVLVCTSVWQYLIVNYENSGIVKKIFPTVAITIATTAVVTLSVNSFYAWRIHKMSKHNWWLTGPIAFLSVIRVGLAFTTTVEMLITKTFPEFATKFKILFTSGLFVSAVTDVIISVARYYYLRNLKQGYLPTQEVVDTVVVFTINDGFLTCAVVIASIGFWLGMPHNFVYLGIYFTISKFYSNSVLATLNLRNWYRHQYTWNRPYGLSMIRTTNNDGSRTHAHDRATSMIPSSSGSPSKHAHPISIDEGRVEVFVDHQVEYNVGNLIPEDLDALETHSNKSHKSVEPSALEF
ncbi:hypothetical protein EV361DRAFT_365574 [Lentinula raphanica]|uniref:DUF6534 domain-containing protein n=1 Tax=Lentinula raphanica TaxID=153919 RepID=A0AA38P8U6_9AGAR|nr:hypothetical protein F5880DRAFT_1589409 [Lentinula raphanica]KAJ3838255.1 hypothetical protein F5878DRAFT_620028 [Lentinula raphanica]KAJ3969187.1 hypothetical protein EV361DRAFT_365574 [Lentinula raphanica]